MPQQTRDSLSPEQGASFGVVIVNYQTFDLTLECVKSLLAHQIALPHNIVVVDNASPDGSGERLKQTLTNGVRVILSGRNGGFGAGVNLGVSVLTTDLVLVLNPDTYFQRNDVAVIRQLFADQARLGIVGLKLVNPDGTLQYSARRFYSLPDILARRTPLGKVRPFKGLVRSHLLMPHWRGEAFETDWVMGTGFVLRRSAFEQVGAMDEGYFLYFEEVDLCARMWINGWQVMALPQAELVHEHQRHSAAGIWSKSGKTHLRSMTRFFRKFGIPWIRRPGHAQLAHAFMRWRGRSMVERVRSL